MVRRLLDGVERLGNRLPDPLFLFVLLAALVALTSAIAANAGVVVTHPGTGEPVVAVSLLTIEGQRRMWVEAVKNFTSFPPLGTVLVAMLGIGVADRAGLIAEVLRGAVARVSPRFLSAALVFAGVNASIASDAGFVVLVPLGAAAYASVGRHPLAGLAAAFAGVSGGFSANLLITALDPLLAGITQAAVQLVEPTRTVNPACNWYFMIAATGLLTVVGSTLSDRVIEPRLGPWRGTADAPAAPTPGALPAAGVALLLTLSGFAALAFFGVFRDDHGWKPLFDALVPIVSVCFLIPGVVYGWVTGKARTTRAVAALAAEAMATMSAYLVLAFAAAQFVAWFGWSNLGLIVAVNGARGLESLRLPAPLLLVAFVGVSCLLDLLVASASAKWAVMAPVFVPMLYLVGIPPEATQAAYRVGDSVTNLITPLMPYFPLILVYARRYDPSFGVGTLMKMMLPYSVVFGIAWTLLLGLWITAGWPLGLM